MPDVIGCVVVHAVEVVGAAHERPLFLREGGEPIAQLLDHAVRVLAKVHGVGKPADGELDLAVARLDVLGVLGIPGVGGVAVQGDADFTPLGGLEIIAISLDGASVGDKNVVANNPGLAGRVTDRRLGAVRGVAGGEIPHTISEDGAAPRLVEGDPVLALGNGLEHDARVLLVVKRELMAVQEAAVSFVEPIREIPVKESDEGDDSSLDKVVNELDVVVNTGLVHRVVAATNGDNSRPRDGETVRGSAKLFQKSNVLVGAIVGIASNSA